MFRLSYQSRHKAKLLVTQHSSTGLVRLQVLKPVVEEEEDTIRCVAKEGTTPRTPDHAYRK
jgi:hypothetical protein